MMHIRVFLGLVFACVLSRAHFHAIVCDAGSTGTRLYVYTANDQGTALFPSLTTHG